MTNTAKTWQYRTLEHDPFGLKRRRVRLLNRHPGLDPGSIPNRCGPAARQEDGPRLALRSSGVTVVNSIHTGRIML